MLYLSKVCNFLRIAFHIGYIPLIIYFGVTNQGRPLELPISLWSVFMPLSPGQ
ncbi:mitochondrial import receptor subunit TOM7 [Schistosoma bovis]|uniref:Mitochondrial import receptor subunit TOM7 n=1 Tax=Schistosoma bovis TaxID=6184 RepID=A0A430QPK0_SCHBO|nr:mitochondrial import receptor subunit TOM7 [Schistosoma bovis]